MAQEVEALRARATECAGDLSAWAAAYLRADGARRAALWADGTGLGELVLEQESGTRFIVDVRGHSLPDLDVVFTGLHGPWPCSVLSIAAALCARVSVEVWTDGRALTSELVDGMALGPAMDLGGDATRTGYRVTFELDTDWFPSDSRLRK
jgi:hypothetical protein